MKNAYFDDFFIIKRPFFGLKWFFIKKISTIISRGHYDEYIKSKKKKFPRLKRVEIWLWEKKKRETPKLEYRFSGCFRIFSKRYPRNLGINAKLVILRMFSKKNFEDSFKLVGKIAKKSIFWLKRGIKTKQTTHP